MSKSKLGSGRRIASLEKITPIESVEDPKAKGAKATPKKPAKKKIVTLAKKGKARIKSGASGKKELSKALNL